MTTKRPVDAIVSINLLKFGESAFFKKNQQILLEKIRVKSLDEFIADIARCQLV